MPHLVANHILIPEIAALLQEGRQVVFTPTGFSMRPFIEGGHDTVILVRKPEVKVGDICLARIRRITDGEVTYVLHRVVRVDSDEVTLAGDGNLRGEEHCKTTDILGTVVRITSPRGLRKPRTRGWIWRHICRPRRLWLKLYRHTIVKHLYHEQR
jgi:hypothetical protein